MWVDPAEARSDFVLAAAVALFGPLVISLLIRVLPWAFRDPSGLYLRAGLLFAFTGLVPLLLARYREQGREAFGLEGPKDGLLAGLLLAIPVVVLGVVSIRLDRSARLTRALAGVFGAAFGNPVTVLGVVANVLALFAGALLLYMFLTVKARDGFAHTPITQLEALRTYGMAAAAAAGALGLLVALQVRATPWRPLLSALALAALVLVADRLVTPGATTTRATVLAPAAVALLVGVELLGRNLLPTLYQGVLAAGFVVVVAVLVETRRYAWATLPLFAAVTVYANELLPV